MKRLFSGNRSGKSSPRIEDQARFDTKQSHQRSRSSSNLSGTPQPQAAAGEEEISPELAPIVTLLSAQSHRRYNEGVFMLLQSINAEGEAVPNRKWREVYGVLLGTQLAVWDIEELEKHQNNTEALLSASAKPDYINFTDSSFRAVNTLENSQRLKNVIIVSTTLKNQYLLQYPDIEDFHRWNSAFRLSTFEYTSLQEAYTGALLSSRGSKLSDIRTILADTKFDYEDWVSVRFGSGMPWKRCFAVIEQPAKKSKGSKVYKGTVSFYKDEKRQKKQAMAFIKDASAAYALYPTSVKMIDHSTMIKLEGTVYFDDSKKSVPKEASVYFMPEQHSAVPGYDTLIRFLVPLLDTFALYGRPKRLNANKTELNSLLFGLPVLPHVHYLEVDDLLLLTSNVQSENWLVTDWRTKIKEILARKLPSGYTGCGSTHGVVGAINSPALNSTDFLDVRSINSGTSNPLKRAMSPLSPRFLPEPKYGNSSGSRSRASSFITDPLSENEPVELSTANSPPPRANRNSEITQIYEDYSGIVKANKHYNQSLLQQSTDSFSTRNSEAPLNDPYAPYKTNTNPGQSQGSLTRSHDQKPVDDDLDEDFDNDDIFKNGVASLNISNNKKKVDEDVFNPDYGTSRTIPDEPPSRVAQTTEPTLKMQTSSKALPPQNIRIQQASPYTSGRISQQLSNHALSPQNEQFPIRHSPPKPQQQRQPPPPHQQQYQKPVGPRTDERFTPNNSQEQLPQKSYQEEQFRSSPNHQQHYPTQAQQQTQPRNPQVSQQARQGPPLQQQHQQQPQRFQQQGPPPGQRGPAGGFSQPGYGQPQQGQYQRGPPPPQQVSQQGHYHQGPPLPQQQQPFFQSQQQPQQPNGYNKPSSSQAPYGYNQPPHPQQQQRPPQFQQQRFYPPHQGQAPPQGQRKAPPQQYPSHPAPPPQQYQQSLPHSQQQQQRYQQAQPGLPQQQRPPQGYPIHGQNPPPQNPQLPYNPYAQGNPYS